MTRPQIIRADTLDLQDRASPTAQDHSRQPQHPAPLGIGPAAPHQEASLRQVDHERHSEEAQLQNGTWSDANTLHDEPDSDDERTMVNSVAGNKESQRDEQAVRLNGGAVGDNDDADLQEADAEEDMDDGGISSSPSIDDGGYSSAFLATAWPERSSSLPSSPIQSPASFQSPSTCVDSSSPFTTTPIHFPLSVAAARKPFGVPAASEKPISTSISSHRTSPIPFLSPSPPPKPPKKSNHHRGEYTWITADDADDDDDTSENDTATKNARPVCDLAVSPKTELMVRIEERLSKSRDDSQISLVSDLDDDQMKAMQQPLRSPTVDPPGDPFQDDTEPQPQPSEDAEDDDAWTTDSDADSWDEEAGNDDDDDSFFSKDPRFVDSGWGGECLRETEDIDFDFVYALHTFVATVEGQANALKGDTMVLLDDSNSYWWLVRVVKDSSIGYLPAEHIETPTERLARLNKHRNIDLSATMLGDTAERTKNPLKKAIRRRNAKTVQFGEPTYVEASDYDYSSDEDDDELFGGSDPTQVQVNVSSDRSDLEQEDDLKVEPLKLGGNKGPNASVRSSEDSSDDISKGSIEKRPSDEIVDRPIDQKVSRNGTLRNTDSFFKDENAETRKISLTPNLLRDDSSTSTTASRERGASLESLEKNGFADKVKDDKKKKEKKTGMLSGLFKRKDKKSRGGVLDSIDSDMEKPSSEELGRHSPQAKESMEERTQGEQAPSSPQRTASKGKLQKPQRGREDSPSKIITKGILKKDDIEHANGSAMEAGGKQAIAPASTMRLVSAEQEDMMHLSSEQQDPVQSPQSPEGRARSNSAASKLNPMNMLKSSQTNDVPRPEKVKKAKQRVQLDDFDSEEDDTKDPFADPNSSSRATEAEPTGRLSESPVQISVADTRPQGKESTHDKDHDLDAQRPPGLTADTSSQETPSPVSTPSPDHSPSTNAPSKNSFSSHSSTPTPTSALPPPSRLAPVPKTKEKESSPTVSSEASSLPAWSDTSLRMYLDDGSDIRDTLALIHDTTGVVPVGRDHPLMSSLFVEESKAVTQLGGELDSLLTNWLENKRRKHKASAAGAIRTR